MTLEEQEYTQNYSIREKRGVGLSIALAAGSTLAGTSAMAVSQALGTDCGTDKIQLHNLPRKLRNCTLVSQ